MRDAFQQDPGAASMLDQRTDARRRQPGERINLTDADRWLVLITQRCATDIAAVQQATCILGSIQYTRDIERTTPIPARQNRCAPSVHQHVPLLIAPATAFIRNACAEKAAPDV